MTQDLAAGQTIVVDVAASSFGFYAARFEPPGARPTAFHPSAWQGGT